MLNMKIKLVKDYWTPEEVLVIVAERTGKAANITLKNGEITLEFDKELPEHERIDLETYFGADHDLPTVTERGGRSASGRDGSPGPRIH